MEFELPKINVSFEYGEEKDEIVFVINGVEKRVKTEDIIKKLDEKQPRFIMHSDGSLEQIVEYCEDCISRQAVLDALNKWDWQELYLPVHFKDMIDDLPSIQPKPKTGHWINAKVGKLFPSNDFKCSECGNILDFNGVNCGRGDANYCPNCGAKMEEEG